MKLNTVGVVLKPNSTYLKQNYKSILTTLTKHNINYIFEQESAKIVGHLGMDFAELCQKCDFLLCVGGDGTLISTVRKSYGYDIPILGINFGKLGFLIDLSEYEFEDFIKKMQKDEYRIDERLMLKLSIDNKTYFAFNDIVLCKKTMRGLVDIDATIDDKRFNHYRGDGVIVSTPTGSTAYNLSCGGPVVYPLGRGIVVTPISPHSLTQRPVVLPETFDIKFKSVGAEDIKIIIDGQESLSLPKNRDIFVSQAYKKAKLIHRNEFNYFDILSQKLRWGDYDK
jgi:NAD+ kinase